MVRIKHLKKGLIFLLAFLLDRYQEISIKNYYRAFYLPGYSGKRESLYQLASRLIKVGEIEKKVKNGEVYLQLTSKGGKFFDELLSLKKLSERRWDGWWRLVIFDIKEIDRKTRDLLRRKLKSWGFAMWQESIYISPHPLLDEVNEFLKSRGLFPRVVCLEAKRIGIKNEKKFAWVIFKLARLQKSYQKLNQTIEKLLKKYQQGLVREKKFKEAVAEIFRRYEILVFDDPFLPKELLPDSWLREKVKKKLLSLIKL